MGPRDIIFVDIIHSSLGRIQIIQSMQRPTSTFSWIQEFYRGERKLVPEKEGWPIAFLIHLLSGQ